MLRPRLIGGLLGMFVTGVLAVQVASCTLDQYGSTNAKPEQPCNVVDDCDDGNPCTTDVCVADKNICEWTAVADGAAPEGQTPSDCATIMCAGGVMTVQTDTTDVNNDGNPCTTDACTADGPTNEVLADGSNCQQGTKTGTCNNGTCEISCDANNPCDDGNACTDDFCNTSTSKCIFTNIDGLPTPGFDQPTGDCKLHICSNGTDTEINDDADLPDDGNSCTQDVCTAGTPSNPGVDPGTACMTGDTQVCDGGGNCVECTLPSHCINIAEDECTKRDCVANKCVPKYMGSDTLASAALQAPGDCKKVVCNGAGGTMSATDNADLPVDGNLCTKDVCTNGMPTNPPENENTNCGTGLVCNATGTCVGCNMASQCAGMDTECQTRTCTNGQCGFSYTPAGTDVTAGQTAGDCKVLECDGAGKIVTGVDTNDKPVDGNQCTSDVCSAQGVPSNPNTSAGSACSVGVNDACDGMGVCKKSNGKTCGANSECVTGQCVDGYCCNNSCISSCKSCNVAGNLGTCTNVPKGTDDGTCMGANVSCNGGQCDSENGQPCGNNGTCLSDICADGVCCNNSCTTACKSCNVTGTVGTCSDVPAGTPDGTCSGANQCDGSGGCKKALGGSCSSDNDCVSMNCVDGVCCNDSCNGECRACNVMGSVGTCTNVSAGQTDPMTCNGTAQACDGMGNCKTGNGGPCPGTGAADCTSGICADGVCCDTACTGVCNACTSALKGQGANGTCGPVKAGNDSAGDCAPQAESTCGRTGACDGAGACQFYPSTTACGDVQSCTGTTQTNADNCNGAGVCTNNGTTNCSPYVCGTTTCKTTCASDTDCVTNYYCDAGTCQMKKANGTACGSNNECTMGNCVDGYCCDGACNTACKSCNQAGKLGVCSNIALGSDDTAPVCSGTSTCNGAGECLKAANETCMNNGQCASNDCSGNPKICQGP